VAASLLTLFAYISWSAGGGLLLWLESRRLGKLSSPVLPRTISVVIPTLNEAQALPETLAHLQLVPEITEIIVVDGGSRDETVRLAETAGCRVFTSPPGRGGQMRLGAAQAKGDVVLLLHADTWLPATAGRAMLDCLRDATVAGGGFWKQFRAPSWLMRGSRLRCLPRWLLAARVMGDQGLFVRREVLEKIGGVPDVPLMEEFALCHRLRHEGRIMLAGATVSTSARRFAKLGVVRTYLRMGWVTWLYTLGKSPHELKQIYERE
jgi:rSAM/selenodomain-associated transferase 2